MTKNTEYRIDRYLNDELSESEKREFEHEIEQNTDLKREYLATKQVVDAIRKQEDELCYRAIAETSLDDIRSAIAKEKTKNGAKKRVFTILTITTVAAALLLFWFRPYQYSAQEVFSKELIPQSLEISITRGDDRSFDQTDDSVSTVEMVNLFVLNHYVENHQDSIISLYNDSKNASLWSTLPQQTQTIVAFALIQNEQYEQAASLFPPDETNDISSQTAWLKLIVLLKMDDRSSARAIAEMLIKRDDGYRDEAQIILSKLNERILF